MLLAIPFHHSFVHQKLSRERTGPGRCWGREAKIEGLSLQKEQNQGKQRFKGTGVLALGTSD